MPRDRKKGKKERKTRRSRSPTRGGSPPRGSPPREAGRGARGRKSAAGGRQSSARAPRAAPEAAELTFDELKAANDRCLKLINGVVVVCGALLGAVAMKSLNSGMSPGIWLLVPFGTAGGMFASGCLGLWVAHRGFREVDVGTSAYFVLITILSLLTLWLSLFLTFNLDEVKWLVKGGVYLHWPEFYAALPSADVEELRQQGGCTAEQLDDHCWEALKQYLFRSWKAGGLLVVVMMVLLPFNLFFAGTKIGWLPALNAVQSVVSGVSLATGVALLVFAYHMEHGGMVLGCVVGGGAVIVLSLVQLLPNLAGGRLGDSEAQIGRMLFFVFSLLAGGTLGIALLCITRADDAAALASSHVDVESLAISFNSANEMDSQSAEQLGHAFGESELIGLGGWLLLLVCEFLALQALCNYADWKADAIAGSAPSPPSRSKRSPSKRSPGKRGGKYREVDDDEEEDDDEDGGEEQEEEEDVEEGRRARSPQRSRRRSPSKKRGV